jgi:hypothetical protein
VERVDRRASTSVEFYLLGEQRTDMQDFEPESGP